MDYIGADTTAQKVVKVKADGQDVDFIRRKMNGPPAAPAAKPAPAAAK
jgi:hypothetical protein